MTTSARSNQDAIIQQVSAVPFGQVSTYGAIAKAAGLPGYARFVAQVLKKLPTDTKLPWHRIINAQGKISFPLSSDGYKEQSARLISEGITIKQGKVTVISN